MVELQGRFVWYELLAADTEAAKAFYTKVVGWGTQPGPVPGMDYTLFTAGEMPAGGLMLQPEDARKMGAPPSWVGDVAGLAVAATTPHGERRGGARPFLPPPRSQCGGLFGVGGL